MDSKNTSTNSYDANGNLLTSISEQDPNNDGTIDSKTTTFGFCPFSLTITASTSIPTISQWGLIIFGLLIMNLSVGFIKREDLI